MSDERRKQVLLVIVAALAIVAIYRFLGGADGGFGDLLTGPPAPLQAALAGIPDVPWERLDAEPIGYDPKGRNLFDFGRVKPPEPTPAERDAMQKARDAEDRARQDRQAELLAEQEEAAKRLETQRSRMTVEPNRRPSGPPRPAGPPPPPNPSFQFIGYLGPPTDKIAVLIEGEDFYLTRVGEVVQDDFRLVEIGYEWIEIGYTDPVYENQTRRIPMGN